MTASLDTCPSFSSDAGGGSRLAGLALVVAALRSVTTYLVISIYVLLVGPPGLLVAFLSKSPSLLYLLARGGVRLGLALAGIRCRVAGRESLPNGRTAVYCANHVSNLDPPILFLLLHPRLRLLYKAEFERVPILGRAVRLGGFVRVERRNAEQGQWAVEQAVLALRRGESFLVFPEGTRSRTGDLLPFKKGGFVMAIKAQVPLVPVAIDGGRAAMAKGSAIIRPVVVDVRIGTPIETTGLTVDDRDRLVDAARDRIRALLDAGRAERGPGA